MARKGEQKDTGSHFSVFFCCLQKNQKGTLCDRSRAFSLNAAASAELASLGQAALFLRFLSAMPGKTTIGLFCVTMLKVFCGFLSF